ncbi:MAG: flavin reductase family protein [Patescibacteria group bacterium]|nr:flavin reductase family protein [Patescibacteria group bacterium]
MESKHDLSLDKSHRVLSPRIAYVVTTVDEDGRVNAGVFSNLTSVSTDPERLVLGVYKPWDTIRNIEQTKEFVVNVPSKNLADKVWICGDKYAGNPIPQGIDELQVAGLTEIPSTKVRPPRIAECPAHLECAVVWIKDVGDHCLVLADIVAASYSEGAFDAELMPNVLQTQPLFEIGRGMFTYPKHGIEIDREKAREHVDSWLKKHNVEMPAALKQYGKFSKE